MRAFEFARVLATRRRHVDREFEQHDLSLSLRRVRGKTSTTKKQEEFLIIVAPRHTLVRSANDGLQQSCMTTCKYPKLSLQAVKATR